MIDREGGIVSINRSMLAVVSGNGLLQIESGRLASTRAQYLRNAIDRMFSEGVAEYSMRLEDPLRGKAISLLFIHAKDAANVTVLAAANLVKRCPKTHSAVSLVLAAEARVTQQLALGLTVEEAAQELGIKLSTVRTHVQRVFGKVGVSRQPDLLRAISRVRYGWNRMRRAMNCRWALLTARCCTRAPAIGYRWGARVASHTWKWATPTGCPCS